MVKVELEIPEEQVEAIEKAKRAESQHEKLERTSHESKKGAQKEGRISETIKEKTGYEPGEVLKAPIETPKVEAKRSVTSGQLRSLILGFALIIISLVAWPLFGYHVALAVVLVGATFISVGTLVRI